MFTGTPSSQTGLVVSYNFAESEVTQVGTAAGELGKVRPLCAAYRLKQAVTLETAFRLTCWPWACACSAADADPSLPCAPARGERWVSFMTPQRDADTCPAVCSKR